MGLARDWERRGRRGKREEGLGVTKVDWSGEPRDKHSSLGFTNASANLKRPLPIPSAINTNQGPTTSSNTPGKSRLSLYPHPHISLPLTCPTPEQQQRLSPSPVIRPAGRILSKLDEHEVGGSDLSEPCCGS